jgi:hypothetical protein
MPPARPLTAVDGETEPVVVKLGVWLSNTKSRRDKLTAEQLDALQGGAMLKTCGLAPGWTRRAYLPG